MFNKPDRRAKRHTRYGGVVKTSEASGVVLLTDGSALTIMELLGISFELENDGQRNARQARINALMRSCADVR